MKDLAQAVDKPMVEQTPSRDSRIRDAAYRRYIARGDGPGDASTDWREAEAEIDAADAAADSTQGARRGKDL